MKWTRLIKLRENKNLSQKEMASILKIPPKTYNNWELGETTPKYQSLLQLADFFNVTTDYLLGRDIDKSKVLICDEWEIETLKKAGDILNKIGSKF